MKKQTMKDKILVSVIGLFIFFCVYTVIGYQLKIGFCNSFIAGEFYTILTNSLTLTAYYLAPVAAFILFSDWREQHKLSKIEKLTEDLLILNLKIKSNLFRLSVVIFDSKDREYIHVLKEVEMNLDRASELLYRYGLTIKQDTNFLKDLFEIKNEFSEIFEKVKVIRNDHLQKLNSSKTKDDDKEFESINDDEQEKISNLTWMIGDIADKNTKLFPEFIRNQI